MDEQHFRLLDDKDRDGKINLVVNMWHCMSPCALRSGRTATLVVRVAPERNDTCLYHPSARLGKRHALCDHRLPRRGTTTLSEISIVSISVAERSFSLLDHVQMCVKPMPQLLLRSSW